MTACVCVCAGDALLLPIMEFAGKDISSWFDPQTKDVRLTTERTNQRAALGCTPDATSVCFQVLTCVHPLTNCVSYYTPRGRFLHTPPPGPRSDWPTQLGPPWWADGRYEVGRLSCKTRWIRIINTLTLLEQRLEVNASHAWSGRWLPQRSAQGAL